LAASGPDLNLLRQVPIDEESFVQLGGAVWLAAFLSAIGTTVGAGIWAHGHIVVEWPYLATGLIAGVIVFAVDRLLVKMPLNPYRFPPEILAALRGPVSEYQVNAALAALYTPSAARKLDQLRSILMPLTLRLTLSICISFVTANLLLFAFFSPEIKQRDVYITQTTQQALIRDTKETYRLREAPIRSELSAASIKNDPAVRTAMSTLANLQVQLSDTNSDIATLNAAYVADIHGIARVFRLSDGKPVTTSGVPGHWHTADSILAAIASRRATKTTVETELSSAKAALAAVQSNVRHQPAVKKARIAKLRSELADLQDQRKKALDNIAAGNPFGSGVLLQYEALNALEHDVRPESPQLDKEPKCHSFGCRVRQFLVPPTPLGAWVTACRLILLLVDCLPILLKTHFSLRERRPYDALRAAYEEIAVADTLVMLHNELLGRRAQIDANVASIGAHPAT
jgi:hypothetical protein